MSARRTERLLNLTICLMATPRPMTKATIRAAIPDYRDSVSDEAFERMFERDKDDLREMGVPLITEAVDPLFDDEVGYRVDPQAYALPELDVTPDEMAVLTLAARAWQQAALAPAATAALRKLESETPEGTDPARLGVEPRVTTPDPAFTPLYAAVRDRRPVRFVYRTPGRDEAAERHVEPWGVLSRRGRWYVVGFDRDRSAERMFRLSRIEGEVRPDGPAGSVTVPEGFDLTVTAPEPPEVETRDATVRVAKGSGNALRRWATDVRPDPEHPEHDLLTVPFWQADRLAAEVVAAEAVVLDPPEVVERVRARLTALVAAHRGSAA